MTSQYDVQFVSADPGHLVVRSTAEDMLLGYAPGEEVRFLIGWNDDQRLSVVRTLEPGDLIRIEVSRDGDVVVGIKPVHMDPRYLLGRVRAIEAALDRAGIEVEE